MSHSEQAMDLISKSSSDSQFESGKHVVDMWIKMTAEACKALSSSKDVIGLLFVSRHNKKFTTLYLSKIESFFEDIGNIDTKFITGTLYDSCANVG
mgnify:CR=1 FL=1